MGAGAIPQYADLSLPVIGLVAALPVEVQCLVGRLKPGACAMLPGASRLRLCGLGSDNARHAAVALVDSGVTALLSWGSAGALDPRLRPGALVLPKAILTVDGRRFPVAAHWHTKLRERVSHRLAIHTGDLVQSPHPVPSAQQKSELFARTGAVAVDTESAAIAEVAAVHGLPFLAVRAILDPASRNLPPSALVALDRSGRLRVKALLGALLRNPMELLDAARLRTDLRQACATLAAVARLAELRVGDQGAAIGKR